MNSYIVYYQDHIESNYLPIDLLFNEDVSAAEKMEMIVGEIQAILETDQFIITNICKL